MFGLKEDWSLKLPPRYFTLEDYDGGVARWCPGCGDHGVLMSVRRICRDEQIPPEKVVSVSGIGCSSRFPHYMATYGFHGLHGRAMPVAEGVKARRPDLDVWVATGDGDNCSIGAGHWLHSIRYNMNMVVTMFDNNIYGLTKKQTSPTTEPGQKTNTHPRGALLPAIDPITSMLGMTNVSFVAQTVDWNPVHLHDTLYRAWKHPGLGFVRILQRCPQYTAHVFSKLQDDPDALLVMEHDDGVPVDSALDRTLKNRMTHDPSDMLEAIALAARRDVIPIGLFFCDPTRPRYDEMSVEGMGKSVDDKLAGLNAQLDRFAI